MIAFTEGVLKEVGIDVEYEDYTGESDTYIRFFFLPIDSFSADDTEKYKTYFVQVDLFTLWSYVELTKEIKNKMSKNGFKLNFEDQTYEKDTKLYHKILRFYIIKEE